MADLNYGTRWKDEFLKRILQIDKHEKKEDHYNVMTKESYDKLMDEIEEAQSAEKKTQKQYRRLNRFKVINVCGTRKLVTKKEPTKYYLYVDEIFDIIEAAHVAVGHRGRDRLRNETSRIYANITIEMINIFLSMCETCQLKKSVKKRGAVSKPVLHSETNSRCRVDLIDMQTREDRGFKFIMVYQDHLTKFILLRALQSERAVEVARQLLDIFLIFGAPCILYSDNGSEFVNSVIDDLASFWPECKLVRGKPRHSEGSIERDNRDIEEMLSSWMRDNNTTNWSNGLRFVQFMKNRTLHSDIKQSPFKAMFGTEPRVGLITSSLPLDVIKAMRDEDDIKEALNKINAIDEEKKAETLDFSKEVYVIDNVTKMIKTEPADKMDLPENLHPCEFIQLKEEPAFKEEYIEIKVTPDEVHSDFEVVHEIDKIAKVIKDEPVSSDEIDSKNNPDAKKYTSSNDESSCEERELQMTPSDRLSGLGKRRKIVTKQNARKKPRVGKDQATTRPNSTPDKSIISPNNK